MDLREAILRAVRNFTVEDVDDQTIRELIDAAVQAPSAVNQHCLNEYRVKQRHTC